MTIQSNSIAERYQRLIQLIKISEEVVSHSKLISNDEKGIYLEDYKANLEDAEFYYESKKQNALKQIENEVLTPWNETMDDDSVKFWKMIKDEGIPLKQENIIEKVLKRGSIKNISEYEFVLDGIVIYQQENRITQGEVSQLNKMLAAFEKKHHIQ